MIKSKLDHHTKGAYNNSMMDQSHWLGVTEYSKALEHQTTAAATALENAYVYVLGCEHPTVITYGRRMNRDHPVAFHNIPSVFTNRGGLATLHNPGQLVIYPIGNLRKNKMSVRSWVELLLETTASCLTDCNIIVNSQNNGVFTKNGKIASIGINIHKGISTHGLALNVSNDLRPFNLISPCGISHQSMDRVVNHGVSISPEDVFKLWTHCFWRLLRSRYPLTDIRLDDPVFHY